MEYFGIKLKALRQERGITQRRLADIIDVSVAAISSYETGGNYPSIDVLIKLCGYFNVSADYLIGLNDKKQLDMTDLTDEQYKAVTDIIAQFRGLNNLLSSRGAR